MANKYDLQTFYASNTAGASHSTHIGGQIPIGKTRFLTYIRIERAVPIGSDVDGITGVTALVGSVACSDAEGSDVSAGALMNIGLLHVSANTGLSCPPEALVNSIPDRPDINHPILSVAGVAGASNWMQIAVITANSPGTKVFAQYYDE